MDLHYKTDDAISCACRQFNTHDSYRSLQNVQFINDPRRETRQWRRHKRRRRGDRLLATPTPKQRQLLPTDCTITKFKVWCHCEGYRRTAARPTWARRDGRSRVLLCEETSRRPYKLKHTNSAHTQTQRHATWTQRRNFASGESENIPVRRREATGASAPTSLLQRRDAIDTRVFIYENFSPISETPRAKSTYSEMQVHIQFFQGDLANPFRLQVHKHNLIYVLTLYSLLQL